MLDGTDIQCLQTSFSWNGVAGRHFYSDRRMARHGWASQVTADPVPSARLIREILVFSGSVL